MAHLPSPVEALIEETVDFSRSRVHEQTTYSLLYELEDSLEKCCAFSVKLYALICGNENIRMSEYVCCMCLKVERTVVCE